MADSVNSHRAHARVLLPLAVVLLLSILLVVPDVAAAPGAYQVTSTADAGEGTLRAAIIDGNAAGVPYEIDLDVAGTIVVESPLPTLTTSVTIRGRSATETAISGGGSHHLFVVSGAQDLTIQQLTVRDARKTSAHGGAILANAAGAVVTIDRSVFTGNQVATANRDGGAVRGRDVVIIDSTFSGNSSVNGHGGAVIADGSLTVRGSTFTGNSAGSGTGAVLTIGGGTIVNSTFTNNSASSNTGVIRAEGGTLTLSNVTVAANQVGALKVDTTGTINVANSILHGNTGNDCTLQNGRSINLAAGPNLGDTADSSCTFDTDQGDVLTDDAGLEALADNGGPTATMGLQADSPALAAGVDCEPVDQRGEPRSGPCDLGAFQLTLPPPPTTTTTAPPPTTTTAPPPTTTTTAPPPTTTTTAPPPTTTTTAPPPTTTTTAPPTTTTAPPPPPTPTTTTAPSTTTTTTTAPPTTTTTTTAPPATTTAPPATTPDTTPGPDPEPTLTRDAGTPTLAPPTDLSGPAEETSGKDPEPEPIDQDAASEPVTTRPRVALAVHGLGGLVSDGYVDVDVAGLAPGSHVVVTVFSDPIVIGEGRAGDDGSFTGRYAMPSNLEPGDHRVVVTGTGSDGEPFEDETDLTIDPEGTIVRVAEQALEPPSPATPPTGSTLATYDPTDDTDTVLDLGVGGLALVALVGAGGAMAAGMAGGLTAGPGGSASSSRAGGGDRDEARLRGGEVAELTAVGAGLAWGDRSRTWRWPGTGAVDTWGRTSPVRLAPFTPLGARIVNDGAALRAILGGAWLLLPIVGIILGGLAVSSTGGAALPPALGLVLALAVLGVLDATSGLAGAVTFVTGVAISGGIQNSDNIRGVLGVAVMWFAVALIASTARSMRRPRPRSRRDVLERLGDLAIISLLGAWMAQLMVGALPGLTGFTVPLVDDSNLVALAVLVALVARVGIETLASLSYPARLAASTPESTPSSSTLQRLVGTTLRVGVFAFVAVAFLGNGWSLWVGTALFGLPQYLGIFADRLPGSRRLYLALPRGTFKLLVLLVVGAWLGRWLAGQIDDPRNLLTYSFVILALPMCLLNTLPLFAEAVEASLDELVPTPIYACCGTLIVALTAAAGLGFLP